MINFSVLISVYNEESSANLSTALTSIVEQTLQPTEIVLVKDGPLKQELEDVIREYANLFPFFKVIALQRNMGLGEALRIGLDACKYEIVARMDSDDICFLNRFEVQVPIIHSSSVAVLGSSIEEFRIQPGDLGRIKTVPVTSNAVKAYSKRRNPLNHPTVVFKKSIVQKVGSYKNMPLFEDYYLWMRLLAKGYQIENLSSPVLYFRVNEEMMARRRGKGYMLKEFRFINALRIERLIAIKDYFFLISTRLPLRIFPKYLFSFVYNFFLREYKTGVKIALKK